MSRQLTSLSCDFDGDTYSYPIPCKLPPRPHKGRWFNNLSLREKNIIRKERRNLRKES